MESKKRFNTRKLLVVAIFIISLAGLGVSQVYAQTNPITGVMDSSQLIVDTPLVTAGEQATPTPTKDAYAIVEAYSQIGRPDLAYAQLQTVIIENPEQIIEQNQKLNKLNWFIFWEEVRQVYLYFIIIIFILIVMLVKSMVCKLDISEFESGVEIDCKPCKSYQSLVEERIWDLSNRSGLKERYFINQPMEDITFENTTTSKLDDVTGLIKFINKLIPPNVITMSGILHHSLMKGAGVTIRLVKGRNRILNERTFWQIDYDLHFNLSQNSDCFYSLAEPVALWIAWNLTDSFNGMRYGWLIRIFRKIKLYFRKKRGVPTKLRKIYGTENWDSYENNFIGIKYYEGGDIDKSSEFLWNSYFLDPYNRQTLFNLANLKIEKIKNDCMNNNKVDLLKVDFVEPIKLLNEIIVLSSRNDSVNGFPLDVLNFQNKEDEILQQKKELKRKFKKENRFMLSDQILALTYYHLGIICKYYYVLNNFSDDFSEILSIGEEMLKKSCQVIDVIEKYEIRYKKKLLSDENKEMIRITKIGITNLKNYDPKSDPKILTIEDLSQRTNIGVAYNLACYYSSMAGYLKEKGSDLKLWGNIYEKIKGGHNILVNMYMEKAFDYLTLKDLPISEEKRKYFYENAKNDPSLYPLWKWRNENKHS